MTAPAAPAPEAPGRAVHPTILVFSTNNISDPGIDLAGSAHIHYNPGVRVMPLPCTSLIKPSWILHAMEGGFDGVFIASDGDECAYLPDCAERASHRPHEGPDAPQGGRALSAARPHGGHLLGLRGAFREARDAVHVGPGRPRAGRDEVTHER